MTPIIAPKIPKTAPITAPKIPITAPRIPPAIPIQIGNVTINNMITKIVLVDVPELFVCIKD